MRQTEVIEALKKQPGEWITRARLAEALGRKRLNQVDLETLAVLEATGRIEVNRQPDPRPAGHIVFYRAKE